MGTVFISYARADRPLVRSLANDLLLRGYDVWWDANMTGGEVFRDVLTEKLTKSSAVLVIWTKKSVSARWVREEADYALRMGKLVPLIDKEDNLDAIPLGFKEIQTIPVSKLEDIGRALGRLGVPSGPTSLERMKQVCEYEIYVFLELQKASQKYYDAGMFSDRDQQKIAQLLSKHHAVRVAIERLVNYKKAIQDYTLRFPCRMDIEPFGYAYEALTDYFVETSAKEPWQLNFEGPALFVIHEDKFYWPEDKDVDEIFHDRWIHRANGKPLTWQISP